MTGPSKSPSLVRARKLGLLGWLTLDRKKHSMQRAVHAVQTGLKAHEKSGKYAQGDWEAGSWGLRLRLQMGTLQRPAVAVESRTRLRAA